MMVPVDFDSYWAGAQRVVEAFEPEVTVSGWELEDPEFEGEYVIDGNRVAKGGSGSVKREQSSSGPDDTGQSPERQAAGPYDFRWNSHAIVTGLVIKKIRFRSCDGQEVGGLIQYPKEGSVRKYPGIVHFTGYGGELMIDPDFVGAGYAVFNFSHRGMHLGSEGFDRYHPVPLLVRDVDDRERYVYRSIVIDCLLAMKVMRWFGFVDGERLAVMGMSQGAALSIMTGVLDGRVRAVSCDLPWLTDFEWQLAHEVEGPYNELKEYLRRFPERRDAALATLGYFDTLSFAGKLKAPVIVSGGLEDRTCAPESVRNLFGRIGTVKVLLELPGLAHERGTLWRYLTQRWFDYYL